jgi:hypothetical protein
MNNKTPFIENDKIDKILQISLATLAICVSFLCIVLSILAIVQFFGQS